MFYVYEDEELELLLSSSKTLDAAIRFAKTQRHAIVVNAIGHIHYEQHKG